MRRLRLKSYSGNGKRNEIKERIQQRSTSVAEYPETVTGEASEATEMRARVVREMDERMRVVTYARVSTKGQRDRGTSLDDQEKRFSEWLEQSGHVRVQRYAEAMSGGKNMQKATFLRMFADLPNLKVQALVVDSLDYLHETRKLAAR